MSQSKTASPPTSSLNLADEFINRQTPLMRVRSRRTFRIETGAMR